MFYMYRPTILIQNDNIGKAFWTERCFLFLHILWCPNLHEMIWGNREVSAFLPTTYTCATYWYLIYCVLILWHCLIVLWKSKKIYKKLKQCIKIICMVNARWQSAICQHQEIEKKKRLWRYIFRLAPWISWDADTTKNN